MNTKGIKFLSALAVLALAFVAFATIAPAEQQDAATVMPEADTSGVVTLTEDVSLSATYVVPEGTYVIDLNGHTLTILAEDMGIQDKDNGSTAAGMKSLEIKNGKLSISVTASSGKATGDDVWGIIGNAVNIKLTKLSEGSTINVDVAGKAKGIGINTTYGAVTISDSNLTIKASNRGIYEASSDPMTNVVKGKSVVSITAPAYGFRLNGSLSVQDTSKVTVSIAKVGDKELAATHLALSSGASITVADTANVVIDDNIGLVSGDAPTGLTLKGGNALGYTYDGTNCLTAGKGINGGSWKLVDGKLTLTEYNGNAYFDGAFTSIDVIGVNKITTDKGVVNAIKTSAEDLDIGSTSSGFLEIKMADPGNAGAATAIQATSADLTIKGVPFEISITSKVAESAGIDAKNITLQTVQYASIDMIDLTVEAYGIKAEETVSIKDVGLVNDQDLFNLEINSAYGISANSVEFAASVIKISASAYGINATNTGNFAIQTLIRASYIDVDLIQEFGDITFVPYAVRAAGNIKVSNDSVFDFDSLYAAGTVFVDRGAELDVRSGFVLLGNMTVYGIVNNTGDMAVLANITLNDGEFNNAGNMVVYANKPVESIPTEIDGTDIAVTAESGIYISAVGFATPFEMKADGTMFVALNFTVENGANDITKIAYGTLTISDDKKVATFSGTHYEMKTVSNEEVEATLYIDIEFTPADTTAATTASWTVRPSGTVFNGDSLVNVNVDSTTGSAGEAPNAVIVTAVLPQISVSKGTFTTLTTLKIQVAQNALLTSEGKFVGSIAADDNITITKGTFEGEITSKKVVTVTEAIFKGNIVTDDGSDTTTSANVLFLKGTLEGKIVADGNVQIGNGADSKVTMTGDITAVKVDVKTGSKIKGNVSASADSKISGELEGDFTMNGTYGNMTALKLDVVKMKGDLIFTGKYLEVYVPNPSEADKSVYTIKLSIDMNNEETTFKMVPASNATTTTASVPAYFQLDKDIGDTKDERAAGATDPKYHDTQIVLTDGELKITRNVIIPEYSTVVILDGQTLTIQGKNYNIDAQGALKVSELAVLNDKTKDPTTYGGIKSQTYYTADGYDVYCNLGYAVANAVGKEITVSDNVTLTASTIAEDTKVILMDGKTLTLAPATSALVMGDGAVIMIDKGTVALTAGKLYTGTFAFDENILVLTGAEVAVNGTIASADATTTLPAMLNVSLNYKDGNANLVSGNMKGSVTLDNQAADTSKSLPVRSGSLTISDDTTFYASKLEDKAAEYNEQKVITKKITLVNVEGLIDASSMSSALTINGSYIGLGSIIMPSAGVIVKDTADVYASIVDEDLNGLIFAIEMVQPSTDTSTTYVTPGQFTIVPTAGTDDVDGFVTITGAGVDKDIAYAGIIQTLGDVRGSAFKIGSNVELDVTVLSEFSVVGAAGEKSIEAEGILEATGNIYFYVKDVPELSALGVLAYEVTYEDGQATVYTSLAEALNAGVAQDITIENLTVKDKALIVPNGVTINVADGKALNLEGTAYLVLGNPSETLGAEPGQVIGKVILKDTAFVVFYADATGYAFLTDIYKADGTTAAKASEFTINDYQYAYVYGSGNTTRAQTDAVLVPELVGYRFNGWSGATTDTIGERNFNGTATPYSYKVTFTAVDGVVYMLGGSTVLQTGVPVEASYGEYITAVADVGYQGKALVNGQASLMVTGDTTVTGSGVVPIPVPEPTPEPEKSEWTITTILLVILVILIAIMAVIVALRLNRS